MVELRRKHGCEWAFEGEPNLPFILGGSVGFDGVRPRYPRRRIYIGMRKENASYTIAIRVVPQDFQPLPRFLGAGVC